MPDDDRRALRARLATTAPQTVDVLAVGIDDDEQLQRFEDRQQDPLRQWKITDEDWRNRQRNRDYDEAAEEMFKRTDHNLAPWNLVGANHKRHARIAVLETLNERIVDGMKRWGTPVPDPV